MIHIIPIFGLIVKFLISSPLQPSRLVYIVCLPIQMDNEHTTGPPTVIITDSEQHNTRAIHFQGKSKLLIGLPIFLLHTEKSIIQPLNVPARNAIAHKSPALVKHAVAEAFQRQADKEGLYEEKDCVVHFKPSAIPFHVQFQISASNITCQHLASVRNINNPVSTRIFTLLTLLIETGPVRKGPGSACKGFLRQAICKSTMMTSV